VDDLGVNVEGATRAGMNAHRFTGRERLIRFLTGCGIQL
jgi:hypothetical protein